MPRAADRYVGPSPLSRYCRHPMSPTAARSAEAIGASRPQKRLAPPCGGDGTKRPSGSGQPRRPGPRGAAGPPAPAALRPPQGREGSRAGAPDQWWRTRPGGRARIGSSPAREGGASGRRRGSHSCQAALFKRRLRGAAVGGDSGRPVVRGPVVAAVERAAAFCVVSARSGERAPSCGGSGLERVPRGGGRAVRR